LEKKIILLKTWDLRSTNLHDPFKLLFCRNKMNDLTTEMYEFSLRTNIRCCQVQIDAMYDLLCCLQSEPISDMGYIRYIQYVIEFLMMEKQMNLMRIQELESMEEGIQDIEAADCLCSIRKDMDALAEKLNLSIYSESAQNWK